MRVFLAALVHETNSFSPLPTTLRSFVENGLLHRPGDAATAGRARETEAYGDALTVFAEAGDEVVAGMCAWAMPSGIVSRQAYESLRDELLQELRAAGPLDAVLLFLHGAMVAEGYPDCEGDILRRVRAIVGAATPVGALLDLHGNVGAGMLDAGAILVACKEYPHTDYLPRARELRALLAAAATEGGAMPTMHLQRVPMIAPLGTTESPMREFVARLHACEGEDGILSVSAMHGFAWSDTPDMGAAILVACRGDDRAAHDRAKRLGRELAAAMFSIRDSGLKNRLPLAQALDAALAARSVAGPVILADSSDNPGGGSACDSTFVLRALLERGVENAALGMIWDPQAALIAADAGIGARIALRIGGKVGPQSGAPLDVDAEVLAVEHDLRQVGVGGQGAEPMGLSVALRVGGIAVVLNSIRQQTFSTNPFTDLGIDLRSKALVVVKSSQHFRTAFDPIAGATVYCNAPGSLNLDLATLPYTRIQRPIWPLDAVATASEGRGAGD
jgi:microcystin degradation protein MlrC